MPESKEETEPDEAGSACSTEDIGEDTTEEAGSARSTEEGQEIGELQRRLRLLSCLLWDSALLRRAMEEEVVAQTC